MNMSSTFIVIPWQKTNNTALYSRDELAEAKPAVVGIFHIGRASESRLRVSCEGGYYVFQTERVLNFLYFTVKLLRHRLTKECGFFDLWIWKYFRKVLR